jgi:hypothetical protein
MNLRAPDKAREGLLCLPVIYAIGSSAFRSVNRVQSSQAGLVWSDLLRCDCTPTNEHELKIAVWLYRAMLLPEGQYLSVPEAIILQAMRRAYLKLSISET